MLDLGFLESLIRALDQSGLDSLEIERGGTRVRLSRTPPPSVGFASQPHPVGPPVSAPPTAAPMGAAGDAAAPAGPRPVSAASDLLEIRSPMVGTFYRAPGPDAPPYVEVGSRVKKGDTLCIIEAMKLMNELEAEVAGVIAEVHVDSGEPVEYGQVLFRVEPS